MKLKKDILDINKSDVIISDCNINLENKFQINIDYIAHGKFIYYLSRNLTLDIHYTIDGYYINEKETGIVAYGEDMQTALYDFNSSFNYLVDNYLLEDDNKLSVDALEIKNKLKLIIKDIEWKMRE